jgi:hypothetical protein
LGITASRTITVTTPTATTAIARRLVSEGSKTAMLEATRTKPARPRVLMRQFGACEIGRAARTSGRW